jgi:hypothetical protein
MKTNHLEAATSLYIVQTYVTLEIQTNCSEAVLPIYDTDFHQ